MRFGGWELLLLLAIALLIFGPSQLPRLGKALGRLVRGLRQSLTRTEQPPAAPPEDQGPDSKGA